MATTYAYIAPDCLKGKNLNTLKAHSKRRTEGLGTLATTGDVLIVTFNFVQSSTAWEDTRINYSPALSVPDFDVAVTRSTSTDGITWTSWTALPATYPEATDGNNPLYWRFRLEHTGTTPDPIKVLNIDLDFQPGTVENANYFITSGGQLTAVNEIFRGFFESDSFNYQISSGNHYQVMNTGENNCFPKIRPVIFYSLEGAFPAEYLTNAKHSEPLTVRVGVKRNCAERHEGLEWQVQALQNLLDARWSRFNTADYVDMNPADPTNPIRFYGVNLEFFGIHPTSKSGLVTIYNDKCMNKVQGYFFQSDFTIKYITN